MVAVAMFGAVAATSWFLLEFFAARKPRAVERLDEIKNPRTPQKRPRTGPGEENGRDEQNARSRLAPWPAPGPHERSRAGKAAGETGTSPASATRTRERCFWD